MKDTELLNVKALMEAHIRQIDKKKTLIVCENLLRFSYEKGLLFKNPFDKEGNLNIDTIIKESNLTELGRQIFDDLADKWLGYTDNEDGKIDRKNNVKMLDKYFNKLSNLM